MASLRYERRIAASADAVWRVVRRPESISEWFPGIVSCTVDGGRRTVVTATGMAMDEEILTIDDTARRFAYRVTSTPLRNHLGVIDVFDLGANDSLCVYSTTCEPDTLALLIAGGTAGALVEIARRAVGEGSA
ncbi:MAG: SRPBCC family protein [Acidimicrobiales bacterium]